MSYKNRLGNIEIIFIVVGILLCTLYGMTIGRIPTVPEIANAVFGCTLVALFASTYGPVVGAVVGFVGAHIICFFSGSTENVVIAFGVCIYGFIIGRYVDKYAIREGGFGVKEAILYTVTQTMAAIVYYVIFYPLASFVFEKKNIYDFMLIGSKYAICIIISSTVILVPVFFLLNKMFRKKNS